MTSKRRKELRTLRGPGHRMQFCEVCQNAGFCTCKREPGNHTEYLRKRLDELRPRRWSA